MITKMFTHIYLCKVNINYMSNDIYTCYVQLYMPTMFSSSIHTFLGLASAFWSTCTYQYTNYCNSIPKFLLTVWKIKISAYLDIDIKTMHVIIYKYQSFHPMDIAIYCKLQWHVQQCLHSWKFTVTNKIKICNNFVQTNDLIWVMK